MSYPMQQEISAQVWVCDDCGCKDAKSCGCAGATARAEAAADRRNANRLASRRSYEKAKQNQQPSNDETGVDNVEELEPDTSAERRKREYAEDEGEPSSPEGEMLVRIRTIVNEANEASYNAELAFDNLEGIDLAPEMLVAVKRAAEAWNKVATELEKRNG